MATATTWDHLTIEECVERMIDRHGPEGVIQLAYYHYHPESIKYRELMAKYEQHYEENAKLIYGFGELPETLR